MIIFFPASKKAEVLSTFDKIIAKSNMKGASCIINDTVSEWITPIPSNPSLKVAIISADITIPAVSDWKVLCKLDATEHGNIIRNFSGAIIPEQYWHGTSCDHCNVNRFRKESYLLSKDGEYKQVGSSCVDEFTGGAFNHLFYKQIQDLAKDCEDSLSSLGSGGWQYTYAMEEVLHLVAATIRVYGWLPSSKANDDNPSTSSRVYSWLNPGPYSPRDNRIVPSSGDQVNIEAALKWVREDMDANNEYLHNLKTACMFSYVLTKNLSIVASLLPSYNRTVEEEERKKSHEKYDPTLSQYVGVVKERRVFSGLKLTMRKYFDNAFGGSFMYLFKDACGNVFKWSTGSDLEIGVGDTVSLKGSVKDHLEYNGTKQTILTRCKIESVVEGLSIDEY